MFPVFNTYWKLETVVRDVLVVLIQDVNIELLCNELVANVL